MTEPTEMIKIRISSEDKEKIHEAARAEMRTFASMCRKIFREWVNWRIAEENK